MLNEKSTENLAKEIERLKGELQEKKASLPAHTIRPHQLLAIEELEDRIRALEEKLETLHRQKAHQEGK